MFLSRPPSPFERTTVVEHRAAVLVLCVHAHIYGCVSVLFLLKSIEKTIKAVADSLAQEEIFGIPLK